MRERTSEINIRVYKSEKEKIKQIAKKAGMNMSDYIRTVAVGKEVKSAPTEGFMKVYNMVKEAHDPFRWNYLMDGNRLNIQLSKIEEALLNLYHGKDGDAIGSDENMGD
jgi:predicted DNA binding CopG/RHH family protein